MIITRAPFRVTLAGGGTDLPSFYSKEGGLVATMAIDKYIYLNFKPNILDEKVRLQYLKVEHVDNCSQLEHTRARESLKKHRLMHSVEISSMADLPSKAGLGSSGSYLVALLTAIRSYKRLSCEPEVIANEACEIEIDVLKEPVGKQDQYISSYGGIRVLDISRDGNVKVRDIKISTSTFNDFLSHVHVYHIGTYRNASDILKVQNKAGDNVMDKLKKIKELGYKFLDAIETQNFDDYGLLLNEHWENKKKMSSSISLPHIDILYEEVKERFGVLGGKIIGAGGGGFLMLYAPSKHLQLEEHMNSLGMKRLHYCVDYQGSKILLNSFNSHERQVDHDILF